MSEIKMLAAGATEGPISELLPEFERTSGHRVNIEFGTVGAMRDRFTGGEKADVIALSTVALDALDKDGCFVSGSKVELGRASCGVAIRDGFLVPKIDTPEAFTAALLAARSVAQTDPAQGGSSGIYFAKLLERMGIAEEMKDKLIYGKAGRDVGLLVRDLRAELGVTFTSEFVPIEGLVVVGNFPKEYEFVNGYGAVVVAGRAEQSGQALLSFLSSATSRLCFKQYGLE
jgi:molybdate transport system substrate-binding protein